MVQEFCGVRMHCNPMPKAKEGQRGEFALGIPLRGQAGGRSGKTGRKKDGVDPLRVGASGAKNTA